MEMEDKPYSVDSSDDINIEEEEEHIEDNHSKFPCLFVINYCPTFFMSITLCFFLTLCMLIVAFH